MKEFSVFESLAHCGECHKAYGSLALLQADLITSGKVRFSAIITEAC